MTRRDDPTSPVGLLDAGARDAAGPTGAVGRIGVAGGAGTAPSAGGIDGIELRVVGPRPAVSQVERLSGHGLRRVLAAALLVVLAVAWSVTLRPQVLGGPVSYVKVVTSVMAPTVHFGDVVVTRPEPTYRPGDVVVYRSSATSATDPALVVGRVDGGSARAGYVVSDDATAGRDQARPLGSQVVGRVWFRFPSASLVPMAIGFGVVFVGLVMVAWPRPRSRRRSRGAQPVS